MTSTYSPNLNLQLQGVSDNSNTWGTILNTSVFTNIDQAIGGTFAPSVAGSSDYTLSQANSQNLYHAPSGTLTGNINYIFPANVGRIILFNNNTSGAFTLTVKSSGGTGIAITQGSTAWVFINSSGNVAITPFVSPTPVAQGGTGDTGTAWTSYSPNITASSGSFTTVSGTGRYKTIGKTCFIECTVTCTSLGTAATAILVSLPNTAAAFGYTLAGINENTANFVQGYIPVSGVSIQILPYLGGGAIPIANGQTVVVSGVYETT